MQEHKLLNMVADISASSFFQPNLKRKIQLCNDVELNPGPKRQEETPIYDNPRVTKIEEEVASVRQLMENLDASVATLITAIEDMKPAYQHALRVLSTSGSNADGGPGNAQKNNLVFYGLPPEPLEKQMEAEPEFCRDILETRIKTVFREHLKISRDIPFTHVYRFTTGSSDPDEIRPIIAGFRSLRDKENILRHCTSSKSMKKQGIYCTEDFSSKGTTRATAATGPDPLNPPGSPKKLTPTSPRKSPIKSKISSSPKKSPSKEPSFKDQIAAGSKVLRNLNNKKHQPNKKLDLDRELMESSAGLSDRMSSFSDYAPSSNSGNSSSGAYTDD